MRYEDFFVQPELGRPHREGYFGLNDPQETCGEAPRQACRHEGVRGASAPQLLCVDLPFEDLAGRRMWRMARLVMKKHSNRRVAMVLAQEDRSVRPEAQNSVLEAGRKRQTVEYQEAPRQGLRKRG